MIEVLLILFGGEATRRRWWLVALVGGLWMALGAFFFINAFTAEHRINPVWFALPLLIDGVLSFASAFGKAGAGKRLRFGKSAIFIVIGVLIIGTAGRGEMIVGLLVGTFLVIDAGWRGTSAYIVRYPGWRRMIALACIEFLLGLWSFVPWPSHWQGEVGSDVGLLLMISAANICWMAWRLASLRSGQPISRSVARWVGGEQAPPRPSAATGRTAAIVHVWTPTGALASLDHTLSRYVAARDEHGVVSTGHAAMEVGPIYVSHYPAVEIERDSEDFRRILRATAENDVAGHFQPSYAEESAGWCASTMQVRVDGIDFDALQRFWSAYSADKTYNLTNRNCSSTVATALDAGVEGVFAPWINSPVFIVRLLASPELWVAAELRARARAMAWTPGIVLDYARALAYLLALPDRLGMAPPRRSEEAVRATPAGAATATE
jgi:uncharacterized membrane protein HdeD (DUF308 family)